MSTKTQEKWLETSIMEVVEEVGSEVEATPQTKKRTIAWLKRAFEWLGEWDEPWNLKKLFTESSFLRGYYRGLGQRKILFICECVLLYINKHNLPDQFKTITKGHWRGEDTKENHEDIRKNLKTNIEWCRIKITNIRDIIREAEDFNFLKNFISNFASSNIYDLFWEKMYSLAKTQEELFFVVCRSSEYDFWPEAVRKLAEMKDLSPIK